MFISLYFDMKIQKSCGLILFDKDCKILLVKGRHGHWWFPKWHIEQWESCLETALRELKEETWLDKTQVQVREDLIFTDEYIFSLNGKKILKFVDYITGRLKPEFETKINIDTNEIYGWNIVPIEVALKLLDFKNQRNILQKAYSHFCKI